MDKERLYNNFAGLTNTEIDKLSIDELRYMAKAQSQDIETLAHGIVGTLRALGVKDIFDEEGIGKAIFRGLPGLLFQATTKPTLTAEKFRYMSECLPLLEVYKTVIEKLD